jgi:hypothetical protein
MLRIEQLCTPEYDDTKRKPSHDVHQPESSKRQRVEPLTLVKQEQEQNESAKQNAALNYLHDKPRQRQRFSVKERFEIIQELKKRKCTINVIAEAHNTSARNIKRWNSRYGGFDNLTDVFLYCGDYAE